MADDTIQPEGFKPEKPARFLLGGAIVSAAKRLGAIGAERSKLDPKDKSDSPGNYVWLKNMPPVPIELAGADAVLFKGLDVAPGIIGGSIQLFKDGKPYIRPEDEALDVAYSNEYSLSILPDGAPVIHVESPDIDVDPHGVSKMLRDGLPYHLLTDQECADLMKIMEDPSLEQYATEGYVLPE